VEVRVMAKNLVTKIVEDHMVEGALEPGEEVGLKIDQALLQDATGTMGCLQFERMGLNRVQVDLALQYVDRASCASTAGTWFPRASSRSAPRMNRTTIGSIRVRRGGLPEIRSRLENGDDEVPLKKEDDEATLLSDFSKRERDILLAGGILRQLREKEDEQPEAPERISGEAER
jgi:hypothetical protein